MIMKTENRKEFIVMAEELKDRKDVPRELTWDLSKIYATQEDMLRDADKMEKLAQELI